MWTQARDLTGQRFGKLVALERADHPSTRAHWRCRCDCGNEATKNSKYLLCGDTRSCGCDQRAMRAAGNQRYGRLPKSYPREYSIWRSVKSRCCTKSSAGYEHYGAKGITICDRWRDDFAAFLADMGPCPDGLTIDRRDPAGHYTPDNCRWATWAVQAANKQNTIRVTFRGESMTLPAVVAASGVNYHSLHHRITACGESADAAVRHLTRPSFSSRRSRQQPRP